MARARRRVLSNGASNAKTRKMAKELGIESAILYLAPAKISGREVCSGRSAGCTLACLYTAGMGVFPNVQQARIAKTQRFFDDREAFMADLVADLKSLERKARKLGTKPVVRLNGTSDLTWEHIGCTLDGVQYGNVMEAFPNVQFYDYTKLPARIASAKAGRLPQNYHVTFSLSENNDRLAVKALDAGLSVAVVLDYGKALPSEWSGYNVIDGDKNDYRYNDAKGAIVALKAKGKARKDTSGFVRKLNEGIDPTRKLQFATV